jgi:hypothetical protein
LTGLATFRVVGSGFDLMKIKSWLGHKSLEVTQIYLDAEMHDPEEQGKRDAAGRF